MHNEAASLTSANQDTNVPRPGRLLSVTQQSTQPNPSSLHTGILAIAYRDLAAYWRGESGRGLVQLAERTWSLCSSLAHFFLDDCSGGTCSPCSE
jgi:hypothetical protein